MEWFESNPRKVPRIRSFHRLNVGWEKTNGQKTMTWVGMVDRGILLVMRTLPHQPCFWSRCSKTASCKSCCYKLWLLVPAGWSLVSCTWRVSCVFEREIWRHSRFTENRTPLTSALFKLVPSPLLALKASYGSFVDTYALNNRADGEYSWRVRNQHEQR